MEAMQHLRELVTGIINRVIMTRLIIAPQGQRERRSAECRISDVPFWDIRYSP